MMTRDQLQALIDLLQQDGIVRVSDLRAAGASDKDVAAARARGDLLRAVRGIDVVRGVELVGDVRARVALRHAGEGAVLTGLWAAKQRGFRWAPDTERLTVLVEPERRRQSYEEWVRVRRCGNLRQLQVQSVRGLPVAPDAQIVVDASRELLALRDVRGLVLGAVADGRCTVQDIRAAMGRGRASGTKHARRACIDAERGATSPPEAELGDALLGCGRPFYLNCEVWLDDVFIGKRDAYLVGAGVGGEMDSRERHEAVDLLDATLERDRRFVRIAGLSLEHVTPTRFRSDPSAFVRRMLEEADRRVALGITEPLGLRLVPHGPLLS